MRNDDFKLDRKQAANVATRARQLREATGRPVVIEHVKRDGSDSTLTGIVESVKYGEDASNASHSTVTVETEKGPRSANLWSIKSIILG